MIFNIGSVFAATDIWNATAYEPTSVEMELIQVSPHAYYIKGPPGAPTDNDGFMSNAGVVITDQGVVVIDALGTPSLAYLLLSKIREITDQPIVKVLVTHYHADHIYGLQIFKDLGAEIIAPAGVKDYLASPAAEGRLKERRESLFPWVDEKTYLVTPDIYITNEYRFRLGKLDFVLIPHGSTHSHGDMSIQLLQEKVLFAGDLIFEGRIPFVAGANAELWMDSLISIGKLELNVVVPGHGATSPRPADAIQFTYGYLNFLHKSMKNAVEELIPFDEVYSSLDWMPYQELPAFRVNRMNAYSVYIGLEAASVAE